MYKYLIYFSFCLVANSTMAQKNTGYYNLTSLHWHYYEQQKYDSCLIVLKQIEQKYDVFPPDIPIFLQTCIKNNDTTRLEKMIKELFRKTNYDTAYIAENKNLKKALTFPFWNDVKEHYNDLKLVYFENIDIDLVIALQNMYALDRYSRINYPDTLNKIYCLLENIDKLNFKKLKKIISEEGFPKYSEIGKKGFTAIYYIFMHNTTYNKESFLYVDSVMKEQMCIGNWEPWRYANIVDRYYKFTHGYQLYGTFIERKDNNEKFSSKIIDVQYLDKRRREIGLPPYFEYAKFMKFTKLPQDYKY